AHVYNQLMADIRKRQSIAQEPSVSRTSGSTWLHIAAMLVVVASVGLLMYFNPAANEAAREEPQQNDDILLPDQNQALLTLADGRTIVLSDSLDGILALESGVSIRRGEDGSIIYDYDGRNADLFDGTHKFNTFSTPKGHTYQLVLPDGTRVWLNTASSIHYPVVFAANERKVTLIGEAYFEVAHDRSRPFKVEAKGSVVEVLGTHFNVASFEDDTRVTTTLLAGAVNVSSNRQHVVLKPGEQAVVDESTEDISRAHVDVRAVMAWRNGYFRFDNESIESILKKISRWYDIETVAYQGQFNDRFTGTFQRSKSVSLLFSHLEKLAPIQFEIKERRVVVM